MTPNDFCYWLDGVCECTDRPSKDLMALIRAKLKRVVEGEPMAVPIDWDMRKSLES